MRRRTVLATIAFAGGTPTAIAQESFPSRPVSMVVAFPPGGQADVVGRPVAATLERIWRVAVPIVNRGGAAGAIGNAFVARAAPDGYTLLMALSSMALLPEAARVNGREPSYTPEMLTPIALFAADPTVLVVPAASPIRTIEQFIADAKARPGQVSYSSAGNYSALHVPMAQLSQAAGLDMLHVPFQGGGPALTAILGGQVQCLASGPGPVAPHIRSGALRPLATWGRTRLAGFEEVPTLIEKGFPDCEFYIWVGLFAPAATPAPVIERIRAASAQVARDPEFIRVMAASGNTLDHRDGEAFLRFYNEDAARLVRTVRALGRIE
ncbi:tripartite tricarboxylate transporter substrate binding protein [Roseomonas sp. PWR1]|uniref:Tripartite tricarboxylate transporter substrate binding protein n=1 Tax=Roseomonas nitratireducens TaxID=2820810 RepID=A0ABS4AUA3_9PROT|nr:tripartite tricarboxylate transporter substrate binding protein [Neoroseomonas nitratireducens]MBP0464943.1 tripartite tricarboxylate transporter substrate binding protein [Neoroseomonas nitratireducens]